MELRNEFEIDLTLFKTICRQSQVRLMDILTKYLESKYEKGKVKFTPSYIFAEGDIPIVLIAHLDTVFQSNAYRVYPNEIYYDQEKRIMWSPQGLGADDRAGVMAILKIIQDGFLPHIIFTTDEEWGCLGAQALIREFPQCPFKEAKMLIQLDRKGISECVFYGCDNTSFVGFIEQFGFETDFGTYTDITVLGPTWNIAAVNLSVGYFDEHQETERLSITALEQTIVKVEEILRNHAEAPFFLYKEITAFFENK